MSITKLGKYNLKEYRPQILLLGNGVVYDDNYKWTKIIDNLGKENLKRLNLKNELKQNIEIQNTDKIPYSIMASIKASFEDKSRREDYLNIISKKPMLDCTELNEILNIPCDAILTTNYTYELENKLHKNYNSSRNNTKRKFSYRTIESTKDTYLIHTFNKFLIDDVEKIVWHLHGELRRKSSIVLTLDEYSRCLTEFINYSRSVRDKYIKKYEDLDIKSWIDYFIIGDIYVLGLNLNFSEIDLWWLINRKMREKADHGKIIYYCIDGEYPEVQEALSKLNIECRSFNFKNDDNIKYNEFYQKAIEDIKKEIEMKKNMPSISK